jgi:hypothetical protein
MFFNINNYLSKNIYLMINVLNIIVLSNKSYKQTAEQEEKLKILNE